MEENKITKKNDPVGGKENNVTLPEKLFNIENAQSQMRKGLLEFPVLLIIGSKPIYVPDILKQLTDADIIVVEGTLYPLLSRLRRFGFVTYTWEESRSGPPRKMYTLTQSGKKTLIQLKESWNSLSLSISNLVLQYEKSN